MDNKDTPIEQQYGIDKDSTIRKWAVHIANTNFEHIDESYKKHAKTRIIDIVGCVMAGMRSTGSSELTDLIADWGSGGKRCPVMGRTDSFTPPHNAALLNSILARSFDFGVLLPFVDGNFYEAHLSETSVPTALALSEAWQRSGRDMITALIIGDDIAARLIAASNYKAGLNWDSTGTVNRFGATAVAVHLLRLSQEEIMNAFGIVLDQLSGTFQSINDRVHSFKLAQGMAARDGIVAAELSSKGWLGSTDPLFGRYGYFALFCGGQHNSSILTKNLGEVYYADSIFKPYPCCRQMHVFIDCALNLINENEELNPNDIKSITVRTSSRVASGPLNVPFTVGEFPLGSAMFSIAYNVANTLLRKKVDLEHYTAEFITTPEIQELVDKVHVVNEGIPDEKSIDEAELVVQTIDGRELLGSVSYSKGHPIFNPLSQNEIEEKFMRNVAFSKIMTAARAEELLNMLKHLEEIDDVSKVGELIAHAG